MNLKLSRTALRELTRLYRGVLFAAIISAAFVASGARAEVTEVSTWDALKTGLTAGSDMKMTGNITISEGLGITDKDNTVDMDGKTLSGDAGNTNGFSIFGGSLDLKNGGTISDINRNGSTAGVFNVQGGDLSLTGGDFTFKNNTSTRGVIQVWESANPSEATLTTDVNSLVFNNNSSTMGGAIYHEQRYSDSDVVSELKGSTIKFENNKATAGNGGAILNVVGDISVLGDTNEFLGNSAKNASTDTVDKHYKRGGGAIANASGESLYDATMIVGKATSVNKFEGNTSITNGGAIMNRAVDADKNVDLTINGTSTFTGNTAKEKGGAIYNIQQAGRTATLTINGAATFSGNTANGEANDIYNDAGTVNLNAAAGKEISLAGGIDGAAGTLNVNGSGTTGTVSVANALKNQTVSVTAGELALSDVNLTGSTVGVASGATLNTIDGKINNYEGITLAAGANLKADVGLAGSGSHDAFTAAGAFNLTGLSITSDAESETTELTLSDQAVTVAAGLSTYTSKQKYTVANSETTGNIKLTGLGDGTGGLGAASADTSSPNVTHTMTDDEGFGGGTVAATNFELNGNNKSVDLDGDLNVASGKTFTAQNVTFEGSNDILNAGTMIIKDSNIDVDLTNNGVLISDPTTYSGTVTNNTTASFTDDTFTSTATLANNGTASLTDTTFETGSNINGTGTLQSVGGTNVIGATVTGQAIDIQGGSTLQLIEGSNIDGAAVTTSAGGGTLDLRNDRLDTLGSTTLGSNLSVKMDANLSTGATDAFGSFTSNGNTVTVDALELLALGSDQTLTLATGADAGAVTLSTDAITTLQTYYGTVTDNGDGTVTLSGKKTTADADLVGTWGTGDVIKAYDASDKANTSVGANLMALDAQKVNKSDVYTSVIDDTAVSNADEKVVSVKSFQDSIQNLMDNVSIEWQQQQQFADGIAIGTGGTAVQISQNTDGTLNVNKDIMINGNKALTTASALDGANLTNGTVAKAALASGVQSSLDKADSAIQTVKVNGTALTVTSNAVDILIAEGATNGTIKVNNVDVAVHGLGSAAYADALTGTIAANTTSNDLVSAAQVVGYAQAQLKNDETTPADISSTVLTTVRASGSASDTALVTEKAVATAVEGATSDILDGTSVFTGFTMTNNASTPANVTITKIDDGNHTDSTTTTLATTATVTKAVTNLKAANNTWTGTNTFNYSDDAAGAGVTGFSVTATDTDAGNSGANASTTSLTVNSKTGVTITGDLTANGNVTLGDAAADVITVNGTATFGQQINATNGIKAGTNTTLVDGTLTVGDGSTSSTLTHNALSTATVNATTVNAGTNGTALADNSLTLHDGTYSTVLSAVQKGTTTSSLLNVSTGMNVNGDTTVAGTLGVTGNTTVGGTLTVGGANAITGTAASGSTPATLDMNKNALTNVQGLTLTDGATTAKTASLTVDTTSGDLSVNKTIDATQGVKFGDGTTLDSVAMTSADHGTADIKADATGQGAVVASVQTVAATRDAINDDVTTVLGGIYKVAGTGAVVTYDNTALTGATATTPNLGKGFADGQTNLSAALQNYAGNVAAATGLTYNAAGANTTTYVVKTATDAANYADFAAGTSLKAAVDQTSKNIGLGMTSVTARSVTGGTTAATQTVNQNLSALDATIGGDMTSVTTRSVAGGTTAVTQTVNANLSALDAAIGADMAVIGDTGTGIANRATAAFQTKKANTINQNLSALDAAIGVDMTAIGTGRTTTAFQTAAGNSVNANLTALDATIGADVTTIASTTVKTGAGDNNGVVATNTVNQNLSALNAAVGDIATLSAGTGATGDAITNGTGTAATTVVQALNNIDATMGNIHGLYDGSTVNSSVIASTVNGHSNLAVGTTVEDHLVSIDNAIGDRNQFDQSHYMQAIDSVADAMMSVDHNLYRVEKEMRGGFASMAAMSALVPNARAAGDTQISVGVGAYRDHQGMALGAFHYFNDNILANVGASYGGDKSTVFRAGVTFGW